MRKSICFFLVVLSISINSCTPVSSPNVDKGNLFLMVLGVAQDAGYPQAACKKSCCANYWNGTAAVQYPACLAVVDEENDRFWLFEATPDIKYQLDLIYQQTSIPAGQMPEAIFLTHAHIGHYTGLIHLGREVVGANQVPVYCLPKMAEFLSSNGPWSQLVDLDNIDLRILKSDTVNLVDPLLEVVPMQVPHRDEFSETAGFQVKSGSKEFLFIPDIDKWNKWETKIQDLIQEVDMAFLDATFYQSDELPNRDMSEIPHPFVVESMELFSSLPEKEREKVHFIHFNHTNRLIFDADAQNEVLNAGYQLAVQGMKLYLEENE